MKCAVMKYVFVVVSMIFILVLPVAVFAHGVEVFNETGNPGVQTIRFGYTDGEPMLFAKVKVFSPSSPDAPVQESIADRAGYFSFIPFEAGEWRLTAEDGMGHRGTINISVNAEGGAGAGSAGAAGASGAGTSSRQPLALKIVLGLSLLANIFGGWIIAARYRRKAAVEGAGGGDAYK
jgi:uncharacterized GH25 family protein